MDEAMRSCALCGELTARPKYCSRSCSERFRKSVLCAGGCGGRVWIGNGALGEGKSICYPCRRIVRGDDEAGPKPSRCAFCELNFDSKMRSDGRWIRTCSKSCSVRLQLQAGTHNFADQSWQDRSSKPRNQEERRAVWQQKNWKRRAKKRQLPSEPYTTAEIAERDGFRCGLCGRKVDMSIPSPHPRAPSIDHIVPISWDGPDIRANVQLAHRGCNSSKGNRVKAVQPLLFG